MNTRLFILSCVGLALLIKPALEFYRTRFKDGLISGASLICLMYGLAICLMSVTVPFGAQIVDFLNAATPYVGWGLGAAIVLAFVPSYHIAPKLYRTHGMGCEAMRFIRHEARVGYARYNWQMMKPALGGLLWRATNNICNEHECNYFEVKP